MKKKKIHKIIKINFQNQYLITKKNNTNHKF